MGLDLALGGVILIAAIRGYFKGFVLQAIGLVGLVACVFTADPALNVARPYGRELFPAIDPALLDRLLWWSSAVASYVFLTGMAGWVVRVRRRRRRDDEPDRGRGDGGAGFLLGGLKGALVAAFVAAGVLRYAPSRVEPGGLFEAQLHNSLAISWAEDYRPAERIWASKPVQAVVHHVRARGFGDESLVPPAEDGPADPSPEALAAPEAEVPPPVQTARRAPSLRLPPPPPRARRPRPGTETILRDVDDEIRHLGIDPLPADDEPGS